MTEHVDGWTDENTHDPGITLAEVLEYALVEARRFARRLRTDRGTWHRALVAVGAAGAAGAAGALVLSRRRRRRRGR